MGEAALPCRRRVTKIILTYVYVELLEFGVASSGKSKKIETYFFG